MKAIQRLSRHICDFFSYMRFYYTLNFLESKNHVNEAIAILFCSELHQYLFHYFGKIISLTTRLPMIFYLQNNTSMSAYICSYCTQGDSTYRCRHMTDYFAAVSPGRVVFKHLRTEIVIPSLSFFMLQLEYYINLRK